MSHAIATDHREHRRLQLAPTIVRTEIEQDGKRREGYLINVSLGGAFLSIADPPATDTTTDLHIVLPWGIGGIATFRHVLFGSKPTIKSALSAQDYRSRTSQRTRETNYRAISIASRSCPPKLPPETAPSKR